MAEHDAEREDIALEMESFRIAAEEDSFSGHLRQAIHQGGKPLSLLCRQSRVEWDVLRQFLAAEAPLPTDALNRIAAVLKLDVVSVERQ